MAGSKTRLPFAYPWTELHQTRFLGLLQAIPPESSVGNGKTPLLADWHGFGGFLAGSNSTLPFAYPWTELHQTRFLWLLQAIPPELGVGSGKIPVLADYPNFAPWSIFGVFSAGSKTTLSCAYLWTELHQTRFPGLLQAIPPESSVRIGKIPVLADYPNFAPWSNFWRFFGRLQDDAVLRLPLDRIAPKSVSCVFAGHST